MLTDWLELETYDWLTTENISILLPKTSQYALRKDTFTLTNDTWCNLKFGKHHLSHINKLPPDGLEEMTQKNQMRIQKFQNQGRVIILGDWGLF